MDPISEVDAAKLGFQNGAQVPDAVACDVVDGAVPSWLTNSLLYRVGPGLYDIPVGGKKVRHVQHWIDGVGMIHEFHIRDDGSVWYRNRVAAQGHLDAIKSDMVLPVTFGQPEDPCVTIFGKAMATMRILVGWARPVLNNGVTVSYLPHPETKKPTLAVKTDANVIQLMDAETLTPTQVVDYGHWDPRIGDPASSSHTEYDPATGITYNHISDYPGFNTRMFGIDQDGHVRYAQIETPPRRRASYMHSFGSTSKYLILAAWPCFIDALKFLQVRNLMESFLWQPEKQTLFYVVDKATMTHVATYESTQAFFCFHTVNAFDDGDDIVLDLGYYDNIDVLTTFYVDKLTAPTGVTLGRHARFHLEAISKTTTAMPYPKVALPVIHNAANYEFQTINERYRHRADYMYVYGAATSDDAPLFNHLVKMNVETGEVIRWRAGECSFPGEPLFVPHPTATGPDDGVILSVVLDGNAKTSFLYVLDAKDFKVIAKVKGPVVVPLGFHGMFTAKAVKALP
ncbi:Aste57867_21600 [Aphanomyces stellatus]|uniref:Aste57867_21600 protein n=1 Tax=Aphanomyces stellatus TaxID=120398 RepID=A0A485LIK8_9STRA|nr:hypothetical protein As57867_021531 [Aphanomyces stellatus]VFT98270.1 Aste57867_21600 [Aphanomyces stellatus]